MGGLDNLRLLVTLQVLVASEGFVASFVITLAHSSANHVYTCAVLATTEFAGLANVCTLQFRRLSLNLVDHHLAVGTELAGRRRAM